jgi:hypothetical protein
MGLTVSRNGQPFTTIDNPYALDAWARASGLNPAEFTLTLSELKQFKEVELRNAADRWYRENIRLFEGAVVAYKIDRGQALTAEEQAIRDAMVQNYQRLRSLIGDVLVATTVEAVLAVRWEEPA